MCLLGFSTLFRRNPEPVNHAPVDGILETPNRPMETSKTSQEAEILQPPHLHFEIKCLTESESRLTQREPSWDSSTKTRWLYQGSGCVRVFQNLGLGLHSPHRDPSISPTFTAIPALLPVQRQSILEGLILLIVQQTCEVKIMIMIQQILI